MKLSNILLAMIIAGLSVIPLLAPERADYLYNYYRDMANGKIACHCDKMKDMQESVQKNYGQNHKIAYIIDCDSSDDPERNDDHIPPVRTFAEYENLFKGFIPVLSFYSRYDFSLISINIPIDTPPPKYSA